MEPTPSNAPDTPPEASADPTTLETPAVETSTAAQADTSVETPVDSFASPEASAEPSTDVTETPAEPISSEPTPEAPVVTPVEAAPVSTDAPAPQAAFASTPVEGPVPNPGHGLGLASLILSIVGVSIVGLILGIIGLKKSKKVGQKNGLALAGIIIGGVGLVVGIFATIIIFSVAASLAGQCSDLGPGVHYVNGSTLRCS
ncbi:MAG: hypothetical protein WAQ27_01875 [Candidatus Microsaccharimonas sp.]